MEQRQVQQQDHASGDYEYDQAHEHLPGAAHGHPAGSPPASPPAGGTEPDGDMSYDEAHDF